MMVVVASTLLAFASTDAKAVVDVLLYGDSPLVADYRTAMASCQPASLIFPGSRCEPRQARRARPRPAKHVRMQRWGLIGVRDSAIPVGQSSRHQRWKTGRS